MHKQMQDGLWAGAFTLLYMLLCVWQIPGTIAARYILFAILLAVAIALAFQRKQVIVEQWTSIIPSVSLWIAILTCWMIAVIAFWSAEPELSWQEFRGQWLSALGAGLIGVIMAMSARADSQKRIIMLNTTVFFSLFTQVLLHDILDAWLWVQTGVVPFRVAPVLNLPQILQSILNGGYLFENINAGSGDKFSYVNNTLAALVMAELMNRILRRERYLAVSWPLLILGIFLVLVCSYLLQFRNGNVGLLVLLGLTMLMGIFRVAKTLRVWQLVLLSFALISLLTGFSAVLYKSDPRWQTFAKTVSHALAIDRSTENSLVLPNGDEIDESAYLRLVWAKQGVGLIADAPNGTGYNRNAFGDGLDKKYSLQGAYRGGHSHSGLVDFTIANGIPGLIIWLLFMASLFSIGWSGYRRGDVTLGLTLMFIVSGFLARSIVDSTIRDHMLQQFMFMSMLYAFLLLPTNKDVI